MNTFPMLIPLFLLMQRHYLARIAIIAVTVCVQELSINHASATKLVRFPSGFLRLQVTYPRAQEEMLLKDPSPLCHP